MESVNANVKEDEDGEKIDQWVVESSYPTRSATAMLVCH